MIDFMYVKEQLSFWPHLSSNEVEFVEQRITGSTYKKGDILYSGGSDCLGLVLLKKGSLCVYMLSEEGKETTLFRLHENEICVLSTSCLIQQIQFDVFVEVEKDCEVYILRMNDFEKLSKNNLYVENFSYKVLANRFSEVIATMQRMMFYDLEKRLAIYLLGEMDRVHSAAIKTTHEQIARHIGSAREAVSRVLKKFEKENYVSLSRKEVVLLNVDKIRQLVE